HNGPFRRNGPTVGPGRRTGRFASYPEKTSFIASGTQRNGPFPHEGPGRSREPSATKRFEPGIKLDPFQRSEAQWSIPAEWTYCRSRSPNGTIRFVPGENLVHC